MDRLLDELTPGQFDEWLAWSRLEPDPVMRIAEILKLGFSAVCLAWGMEFDPEILDPLSPEKLAKKQRGREAGRGREREPDTETVTPDQAAAWCRAMLPGNAS